MTQLVVISIYLALLIGLGLTANRVARRTASDFMFASHTIGPLLLLMSLFGTTMTAFALVGSTGQAHRAGVGVYGLLASASGIIHSLCFFLVGVPLWSLGRRYGYRTQIQFFRDRLENQWIGFLLFPILVFFVVGYLMVGVLGGGAVVQAVTKGAFVESGMFASSGHGVPSWIASAVICLVVLFYVFFGGMRATAWANAFQTAVFMILGVVTFVAIAGAIGGTDRLIDNLRIASAQIPESHLGREKIPKPVFFSFLLIPLSVGMFPHVFQHWLTARSAAAFKLPIVVHPIFIMIVWVPCVLLGAWAAGPQSGIGPQLAALDPHDRGNAVLGLLVSTHAGPLLGGLLTAGILAAIMSSLDSQFLCLGTMFTEDMLPDSIRNHDDEQATVRWARGFVILTVASTYVLSLVLPRSVFDLGLWSFAGFTGLFPLVALAIYWRRLSAPGAVAGTIVTIGTWLVLFFRSDFGGNPRYGFPESPIAVGGFAIPSLHPVVAITLASATTMVLVSLATKPPSDKTISKFFAR